MTSPKFERQVLMIDADDTLWENNIYFEQAIDRFVRLIQHPELSPAQVRAAFDKFEAARVQQHGYGTDAFHQSLLAGFAYLTGTECSDHHSQQIAMYAGSVRAAEMVLLDGVAETLQRLSAGHTLMLVTKGDRGEQTAKLQRSGLAGFFPHVEVLREKDSGAYSDLLVRYGFDSAQTWMIGNSPRSDTNPALAAGLHAVYLPHPSTWVLEQEPVSEPPHGQRLLHLTSFSELVLHFA